MGFVQILLSILTNTLINLDKYILKKETVDVKETFEMAKIGFGWVGGWVHADRADEREASRL